jgi:D-alanyl-D-alanine carboxypeptidase (penicillin-binding protein 5/6)
VGVVGTSILETHGTQKPVPMASTAKLITALVVLQKKPLKLGEQGPIITLTDSDVALYDNYKAQDGSLVKVVAGEKISEYQVLQALMLPSSNNLSDSLAIWAFGSLKAYSTAANQYLASVGLQDTRVGSDASGLSPTTTSTAHDLVKIGQLTMQNPVLAQIVGQSTASGIPVVGDIKNVNMLLGSNGIVGIKTGNSDEAGGVYTSASRATVNGKPVTIVTALASSPSLFQAMKDSIPLIKSAQANFKSINVVKNGTVIGHYDTPWGGRVNAIADDSITTQAWSGSTVTAKTQLAEMPTGSHGGQATGNIVLPKSPLTNVKSVGAKLESAPSKPSVWWRLTHPF